MEIKVGKKYIDREFILEVIDIKDTIIYYIVSSYKGQPTRQNVYNVDKGIFTYKPMYTEVKATRLARKMFPNAEEENGMLLLEE